MKKESKVYLILVIVIVVIIAVIFWLRGNGGIDEELARCIGQNSELYVKEGCPACERQEELFEENYQYLNIIDCSEDLQKCIDAGISGTPTWIIDDTLYPSVRSVEELKQLTGC